MYIKDYMIIGRMGNEWGGGGIVNCYVYCILYKLIRNKLDYVILEFERKVKLKNNCLLFNLNLCILNKFFEKLND